MSSAALSRCHRVSTHSRERLPGQYVGRRRGATAAAGLFHYTRLSGNASLGRATDSRATGGRLHPTRCADCPRRGAPRDDRPKPPWAGVGLAGRYTVETGSPATSAGLSPVIKPIVDRPSRGASIKTTLSKDLSRSTTEFATCPRPPYILLTRGITVTTRPTLPNSERPMPNCAMAPTGRMPATIRTIVTPCVTAGRCQCGR